MGDDEGSAAGHKRSGLLSLFFNEDRDTPQGLGVLSLGLGFVITVLMIAACFVLGWAQSCNSQQRWQVTIAAILISLAATSLGMVLGFLFGLPRSREEATNADTRRPLYAANTNLLDISDWLTKVIVGLSLVQIGKLPSALARLSHNLAPMLGYPQNGKPVCETAITTEAAIGGIGVAMCVFTAVVWFLIGYLWTRVALTRYLNLFDHRERLADEQERQAAGQPQLGVPQGASPQPKSGSASVSTANKR